MQIRIGRWLRGEVAPLVALLVVVPLALGVLGCERGPRSTLYVGGPILTMDGTDSIVEALLVEGDRIAAVGPERKVRKAAGEGTRVVDLDGRALLPGFIDAHGHFPGIGLYSVYPNLNSPPIGEIDSIAGIIAALAAPARRTRKGRWVLGFGYDDTLLPEKRHPTRDDLDLVSIHHPVAAVHISGHLAAVNSRALAMLGIDDTTPDPPGGLIVRDPATGRATGVLEETAAADVLLRLQRPSLFDSIQVLRGAVAAYTAAGVTTAQNGLATERQLRQLRRAFDAGTVPIRLVLWPDGEAGDAIVAGTIDVSDLDPAWFRVGAVKLVADGSIQGYTGYLSEPYHVAPGDDSDFRGYPRMSADELAEQVERYHAAGLQVAIHGNGDAAIDMVLDAVEAAQAKGPRRDARPVLVHAQMSRPDQLERMKKIGMIPSFFVAHTYFWGDRHLETFLGPERAERISPTAGARDAGLRFTLHCDAPVVPVDPLGLVWSAVNRKTRSGRTLGEAERITPMQALRAVTIDAAYQHFDESEKGSLEPGKLADLVILSRSPLDDPGDIDEIVVVETIVGGETVYRAADPPS